MHTAVKAFAIAVPLLVLGTAAAAYVSHRTRMAEAEEAWRAIASRPALPPTRFDPAMVADQPEIARRYFAHAIAAGTPLADHAELEMSGTFLLGDKADHQSYAMTARQILRPPSEFVWVPLLKSSAMIVSGSDGLADGEAWTRFWLMRLVPVANVGTSPDMVRSAQFRAATEGLWVPSSLLRRTACAGSSLGLTRRA
jgi:hypothetical protein